MTQPTQPCLPPLRSRLLHLVATFEGGMSAVAGNFDGQLLSFGPLQWNLGQGTLQPLLRDLSGGGHTSRSSAAFTQYLGNEFAAACAKGDPHLSEYVRSRCYRGGQLDPKFRASLKALALTPDAMAAFIRHAEPYFGKAEAAAQQLDFQTERGLALLFDIAVQNGMRQGGLREDHLKAYQAACRHLPERAPEWQRLKLLAHTVADCANPRWHDDVLSRKLSIALGGTQQSGLPVHGKHFNLERDFGIRYYAPWKE